MQKKIFMALIFLYMIAFSANNISLSEDMPLKNPNAVPELKKYEQSAEVKEVIELSKDNTSDEKQRDTMKSLTNVEEAKNYVQEPDDVEKFLIKQVEFPTKSEVFTETQLQQLVVPIIDEEVSLKEIQSVVNDISKFYIINDYITSYAYLPPQDFSSGIVKIELSEGRVGDISISGNKYTKTKYIEDRLHAESGKIFKLRALEEDLIKFNNTNSVKLDARISQGKDPNSTDIKISADDPFPFHLTGVFDNAGRDGSGLLRGGAVLSADSLFGVRDKMTIGSFLGRHSQVAFGDYHIPINKYGTNAGFLFSYNNLSTLGGMYDRYSGNAFSYSGYITHPIISKSDFTLDSFSSANFKYSTTFFDKSEIDDTNVFSLTQGFSLRKDTPKGIWYSGHYASVGMYMLSGQHNFFKYEGNITRLHDFGHGIIGQFRLGGQYSPNRNLPWIEQYQLGGISTVRGFSESLLLGKSGYMASAELLLPLPFLPEKAGNEKLGYVNLRKMIKGAVFVDHGGVFPSGLYDESLSKHHFLTSVGLGLRIALKENLSARLYWGFGLGNNRFESSQPTGRFHFELSSSPDFSKLLKRHSDKL